MNLAILLLASGRGLRMGSATPKVYLPVAGVPILVRSMQQLHRLAPEAEIILAIHPEDRAKHLQPLLPDLEASGLTRVIDGGATRQESMSRALAATDANADLILIHDAARPFFSLAASRQAIHRAGEVGAALLAAPAPDTIKRANADFLVTETVPREGLWLAQTPQVVTRELLEAGLAHAATTGIQATDDVGLVEALGAPVEVVPSSPRNLKITVAADLEMAAVLAAVEDSK